jgi:hypothetical protein
MLSGEIAHNPFAQLPNVVANDIGSTDVRAGCHVMPESLAVVVHVHESNQTPIVGLSENGKLLTTILALCPFEDHRFLTTSASVGFEHVIQSHVVTRRIGTLEFVAHGLEHNFHPLDFW